MIDFRHLFKKKAKIVPEVATPEPIKTAPKVAPDPLASIKTTLTAQQQQIDKLLQLVSEQNKIVTTIPSLLTPPEPKVTFKEVPADPRTLSEREAYITKQIEIDRERKRLLDIRENKIRSIERRLQLDDERT